MDAAELDLEDLPPKALRKLIKSMIAKAGKPRDPKDEDAADEEREALADLHAEKKGKPTPIEVTKDDLPPELSEDGDPVEDEPDGDEDDAKYVGKKKKKGK